MHDGGHARKKEVAVQPSDGQRRDVESSETNKPVVRGRYKENWILPWPNEV